MEKMRLIFQQPGLLACVQHLSSSSAPSAAQPLVIPRAQGCDEGMTRCGPWQLHVATSRAEDAESKLEQVRRRGASHRVAPAPACLPVCLPCCLPACLIFLLVSASLCVRRHLGGGGWLATPRHDVDGGEGAQAEKKRLEMAHDVRAACGIVCLVCAAEASAAARPALPASPFAPRVAAVYCGSWADGWWRGRARQMRLKLSVDAQHSLQMLVAHQVPPSPPCRPPLPAALPSPPTPRPGTTWPCCRRV